MSMRSNRAFHIAALGVFALSCSEDSSNPVPATVPDSAADSLLDASVADCSPACAVVVSSCDSKVSAAECEAQCHKELTGQGYLANEIAVPYFAFLAKTSSDPNCEATKFGPWPYDLALPPGKDSYQVEQTNLLESCATTQAKCGIDVDSARVICFFTYYWFNDDIRAKKGECLKLSCDDRFACTQANRITGQPWVARNYGEPLPE